jgi:hypothetical protein
MAALRTAALLARTGFRVHADGAFCARVRAAYEAGVGADAIARFVLMHAFMVYTYLTFLFWQRAKLAYFIFLRVGSLSLESFFPFSLTEITKERRENMIKDITVDHLRTFDAQSKKNSSSGHQNQGRGHYED